MNRLMQGHVTGLVATASWQSQTILTAQSDLRMASCSGPSSRYWHHDSIVYTFLVLKLKISTVAELPIPPADLYLTWAAVQALRNSCC